MIYFTNSKGERLPEDINRVANRYYDPNFSNVRLNTKGELKIYYGFSWPNTPEKYSIWDNVHSGNYRPFREFYGTHKQARKAEIIAEIEKLQNELKEL